MPLDPRDPITPLQSATIRASLKAIVVNVATILAVVTGRTLDVDVINRAIDLGVPLIVNGVTIYYAIRAIRARIEATETIKKG